MLGSSPPLNEHIFFGEPWPTSFDPSPLPQLLSQTYGVDEVEAMAKLDISSDHPVSMFGTSKATSKRNTLTLMAIPTNF